VAAALAFATSVLLGVLLGRDTDQVLSVSVGVSLGVAVGSAWRVVSPRRSGSAWPEHSAPPQRPD
jgi:hypothetical protein